MPWPIPLPRRLSRTRSVISTNSFRFRVLTSKLSIIDLRCNRPASGRDCYKDGMSLQRDVVIIGGGVIGLSIAYQLAKERVSVVLVDSGDLGRESSWAGAGILPPAESAASRTPLDRLRALSVSLFPGLSAEL